MMQDLIEEVNNCKLCKLCDNVKNRVIGEGNLNAKLVLVGEAPGRREDEAGRPFVGSSGKLLDNILERAGLKREEIYISNVVKCRPPDNRKPTKKEVMACSVHLEKQLEIIKPKIIAPMGNSAVEHVFNLFKLEKMLISGAHGKNFSIDTEWGKVIIVPLYHPAAAIYNRKLYSNLLVDLVELKKILRLL